MSPLRLYYDRPHDLAWIEMRPNEPDACVSSDFDAEPWADDPPLGMTLTWADRDGHLNEFLLHDASRWLSPAVLAEALPRSLDDVDTEDDSE